MEDLIIFESDGFQLEALYTHQSDTRAVVITHPHSLYGGDMYNSVVYMLHKTYSESGYTTFRFNFRGVGKSGGRYDDGIGEQNDLLAAFNFLKTKGFTNIDLAGYSFGSWVGAALASKTDIFKNVILVSPPVSFMDFNEISEIPSLRLTVVGDRDEFASLDLLRDKISAMNKDAALEVLPGTDHFYTGSLEALSAILKQIIT